MCNFFFAIAYQNGSMFILNLPGYDFKGKLDDIEDKEAWEEYVKGGP